MRMNENTTLGVLEIVARLFSVPELLTAAFELAL